MNGYGYGCAYATLKDNKENSAKTREKHDSYNQSEWMRGTHKFAQR